MKDIGYFIKTINDKLKMNADADLKNHHLTLAQSRVLTFLSCRGGQATQKEIEDFLEVAHPTVVGIVSRMQQNGHVVTWMDPQCKRNKIVQLTAPAKAIGDEMETVIARQEAAMIRGLSEEEVQQLMHALEVIYQNLNEI